MEDLFIDDDMFEEDSDSIMTDEFHEDENFCAAEADEDEFLDDVMSEVHKKNNNEPSFQGSGYTDAEISKLKDEVSRTKYEMDCRQGDVNSWESKVSLNNTKEHIANGDYNNAAKHLNEAKSKLSTAKSAYESAKSKLNNAL